jgi:hypothetical protein
MRSRSTTSTCGSGAGCPTSLATSCIGRDFKSREIPPPLREAFERHLAADAVET